MRGFFDTNLFIYLWEDGRSDRGSQVRKVLHAIQAMDGKLLTSTFTLAEILVHPVRQGAIEAVREYIEAFQRLELIDFDTTCALLFAEIRARNPEVRPPDVIQLACAARAQCDWSLTNDHRLASIEVEGIG